MKRRAITTALLLATCLAVQAHELAAGNLSFCDGDKLANTCTIYRVFGYNKAGHPVDVSCEYIGGWDRVPLEQPDTAGNPKYPPTLIRTIC